VLIVTIPSILPSARDSPMVPVMTIMTVLRNRQAVPVRQGVPFGVDAHWTATFPCFMVARFEWPAGDSRLIRPIEAEFGHG
jgi:hypothetical protein